MNKKESLRGRENVGETTDNKEKEEVREREREQHDYRRDQRARRDSDDEGNVDQLELCRQAGNGRVLLCDSFNIWIDNAQLTHLQRWLESPKEMTRGLLKTLVGVENLKNMCARGRSRIRRPIPEDILSAVEFYVNKKCTQRLKPIDFTNVVNMMCASLRNPR